jgi:ABC-type antimicrobial peptide transport system permease subunit
VAVINRSMALRYWPSENAIGKRFKEVLPSMDPPWLTVVGVVGDVSLNRDGSVIPVFYQPIRQWSLPRMSLVVRTAGDPLSLAPAVRRALQSVDTTLPYFDIGTVEHGINELDRPRRFQTALIGLFAASALILAAVGLFGLMTYSVEQRTREIGIRIALGATSGSVMRLVLRKSLIWVSAGTAIGIAGAVAFGRALSALLFGITATDPGTLVIVISVLAAVTAFGCLFPTRRVAKVDPKVALRHD